jgi:hypothetical protein
VSNNAEAVRTSTASGTAIGSGSFGSTGAVSSLDAWNTAIGSLSGSDSELNLNSDLPDSEKDLDRDEQSLMNVMVQVDSKHAATPAAIAGATIGLVTLAVGVAAIFKLFLRRRRMLYSSDSSVLRLRPCSGSATTGSRGSTGMTGLPGPPPDTSVTASGMPGAGSRSSSVHVLDGSIRIQVQLEAAPSHWQAATGSATLGATQAGSADTSTTDSPLAVTSPRKLKLKKSGARISRRHCQTRTRTRTRSSLTAPVPLPVAPGTGTDAIVIQRHDLTGTTLYPSCGPITSHSSHIMLF